MAVNYTPLPTNAAVAALSVNNPLQELDNAIEAHKALTVAHGLPANANVLGNKTAAGEFIQHGTDASRTTGVLASVQVAKIGFTITFPVAFSAAPLVIPGGVVTNAECYLSAIKITATGFDMYIYDHTGSVTYTDIGWLALGS